MQIQVDTHTHTYASGHAYSTLIENANGETTWYENVLHN